MNKGSVEKKLFYGLSFCQREELEIYLLIQNPVKRTNTGLRAALFWIKAKVSASIRHLNRSNILVWTVCEVIVQLLVFNERNGLLSFSFQRIHKVMPHTQSQASLRDPQAGARRPQADQSCDSAQPQRILALSRLAFQHRHFHFNLQGA